MLLLQTASINKGIVTNMNSSNSIFSLGADGCNGGWIVAGNEKLVSVEDDWITENGSILS